MPTDTFIDPKWNRRYSEGDTPWDIRVPSRELTRILDSGMLSAKTVLELGCGTGTNAVFLAERGFAVTAVDGASPAIAQARKLAEQHQVNVTWIEGDVCALPALGQTFDLIFDRGCYHCVRQVNLAGYLQTLRQATHPGSQYLVLTGNANEVRDGGPPRLHEQELRAELEPLFDIRDLHEFRFDDPDGPTGPLGWSCLAVRRSS